MTSDSSPWPLPALPESAQPHVLFLVTPPFSGSTAIAELLRSSPFVTFLEERAEGQWLVPGLAEDHRWDADMAVDYASVQVTWLQRWQQLLSSASEHAAPGLPDRRFSHESWHDNGPFTWTAALYLLNAEFMQRLAASVEADRETKDRLSFATQQWVDMLSPSNFLATNPEVQQKLLETRGESLRVGLENLFDDLQQGRIRQTDETAFQIGVNVATSPGAVVFRNELIELIQYAPWRKDLRFHCRG